MVNTSFLQELLNTVAEQGRQLLPRRLRSAKPGEGLAELSEALLSVRGEASGVAIASEILDLYGDLDREQRLAFLHFLANTMEPDTQELRGAAKEYLDHPDEEALIRLRAAAEGPRQGFFRRLNLAAGATAKIVAMRRDLLAAS